MKLIKGVFEEKLELQFAPSIRAGFPSPADEYLIESLDFNREEHGDRYLFHSKKNHAKQVIF